MRHAQSPGRPPDLRRHAEGRIAGQQVGDRTLEEIAQELGEIDPPAFPQVDRVDLDNGLAAIVVTMGGGRARPYTYRGRAYRRVANTTAELSRDEYNRLLLEQLHGQRRWENEPAEGWAAADLDLTEIALTIDEAVRRGRGEEPGTRNPEEMLRALGLMRGGRVLQAAVVLFGRSPRIDGEYPQCLLRAARFRGRDRTEFIDNRQFHGNLFRLMTLAERFLIEHVPIAGRIVPGVFERIDEPLYPPLAVREALANAFYHRDYSIGGGSVGLAIYDDRLEVTSSGTLHFGLTPADLFRPHDSLPWNPLVAETVYRRGLIERWGRGTLKIIDMVRKAGLPPLAIESDGGAVTVRFPLGRAVAPAGPTPPPERRLTYHQRRVLAAIKSRPGGVAFRDLHARLRESMAESSLRACLKALRRYDLIISIGHGHAALWLARDRPVAASSAADG